jgi:uncharacterized phage infection (PIP) family protein YhgE
MGNDLYDENRRLKREIDELREQIQGGASQRERDSAWAEKVLLSFLAGETYFGVHTNGTGTGNYTVGLILPDHLKPEEIA